MIHQGALRAITLAVALAVPAAAAKARLYDLATGKIVILEFKNKWLSGHGSIKGTLPSGQKVQGEFTTVAKSSTDWGAIYASAGQAVMASETSVDNDQRGTAIATGDGVVLECEYKVSALSGHGSGSCRDNKGNKYKLMF